MEVDSLAALLLTATPGWARVGLTMPDPDMRLRAAEEVARTILAHADLGEARQLPLPLGF